MLIGSNACYTEQLDAVKKFNGKRTLYDKVVVNMEWGGFGDKGSLSDVVTRFDTALDSEIEVKNKKEQM